MAKLVSNVYGDALFELAIESNRLDEFFEETKGIKEIVIQNPELSQMMNHPKINKEEKLQAVENIFKGKASDEMVGLLRMIIEKDHFEDIIDILDYFIARVYEQKNIGVCLVTTPMELTEQQKSDVEKRLLETTKYDSFMMEYKVDTGLIGGMVIRIGDRVVDSSIKSKIYDLSKELQKIQLKVGECAQ